MAFHVVQYSILSLCTSRDSIGEQLSSMTLNSRSRDTSSFKTTLTYGASQLLSLRARHQISHISQELLCARVHTFAMTGKNNNIIYLWSAGHFVSAHVHSIAMKIYYTNHVFVKLEDRVYRTNDAETHDPKLKAAPKNWPLK